MTDWFEGLDEFPESGASNKIAAMTEQKPSYICQACAGSGRWRGIKTCFACKGKGMVALPPAEVVKRKMAYKKVQNTKAANLEARKEHAMKEYGIEIKIAREFSTWNNFARSMIEAFDTYGSLTENQLAALRRTISKVENNRQERAEVKAQATAQKSGDVDVSPIQAMFDTAVSNGLLSPKFQVSGMKLSLAPAHGRNAGAIYVKRGDDYLGKISNGRYIATANAPEDTLAQLQEIAAGPKTAAVKYGKEIGRCSCCSRQLTDPDSIRAGIGPICADKWGF